jgi:hypothetical protein
MTGCADQFAGIVMVLAQSRAEAGRNEVVARVFLAAVAAHAAVAGVVGGSVRASDVRVLLVARSVTEIALRIHVRSTAVHLVFAIHGERSVQRRRGVCEGAVAGLTAVVVALVRLGGLGRQKDEGECGRDQY